MTRRKIKTVTLWNSTSRVRIPKHRPKLKYNASSQPHVFEKIVHVLFRKGNIVYLQQIRNWCRIRVNLGWVARFRDPLNYKWAKYGCVVLYGFTSVWNYASGAYTSRKCFKLSPGNKITLSLLPSPPRADFTQQQTLLDSLVSLSTSRSQNCRCIVAQLVIHLWVKLLDLPLAFTLALYCMYSRIYASP